MALPEASYSARLGTLAAELSAHELAAALAFPGPDLQYLLGSPLYSHERLTVLLIPAADSALPPTLVIPEIEATEQVHTICAATQVTVHTWRDGQDAVALLGELLPVEAQRGLIGVSDDAPARHLVPIQQRLDVHIRQLAPVIDPIRAVKSAAELNELSAAAAAIDSVHARMAELCRVGRTEKHVAELIGEAICAAGLTHPEFIIVASGPNAADPHHEAGDRVIAAGDIVVVDIGGPLASGYHSDCTRTYAMGEPAADIAADYEVLRQAQAAARAAVRPGVRVADIDAAARSVLAAAGLGDYFVHRTGHGIGLTVHEAPSISADTDMVLREGMVFSIEPGIYRRGYWGARLEDIVAVTSTGVRELNQRPRTLSVL